MVAFAVERFQDVIGEMRPILERHAANLTGHPDIPLCLNDRAYTAASDAGILRIYTVRDGGELVGYAVYQVGTNLHHASTRWATSDVAWIDPARRYFRVAWRLIDFAEQDLRRMGVVVLDAMTKDSHPAMGRLLAARGYEKIGALHQKRLVPCPTSV